MKVNSIFSKKKKKRYLFASNKKKKKEYTKCFVRTKKRIHRLSLYIFKQKSLSINCKTSNCSQLDKQQPLYFHHSFPSSFNSHHPPIFSNWKSTTASTPSKGNVNTLKSYSNDLVSSLQSGLIACPKAEISIPAFFTCIRFTCRFLYRLQISV